MSNCNSSHFKTKAKASFFIPPTAQSKQRLASYALLVRFKGDLIIVDSFLKIDIFAAQA